LTVASDHFGPANENGVLPYVSKKMADESDKVKKST
jgi:hypothetical protein